MHRGRGKGDRGSRISDGARRHRAGRASAGHRAFADDLLHPLRAIGALVRTLADRHRVGLGLLDDGRAVERVLGHVHGTAADDRPAAGAGAEFRKGHSNRHNTHPVYVAASGNMDQPKSPSATIGYWREMTKIRVSASSLTMMLQLRGWFQAVRAASVPLLDRLVGGVNGGAEARPLHYG